MKKSTTIDNKFDKRKVKPKKHWTAFEIIILVILILYTVAFFFPLVWGVLTSFKHPYDFGIMNENKLFGLPSLDVWKKFNGNIFGNYLFVFDNLSIKFNRTYMVGFNHRQVQASTEGTLLIYIINTLLYAGGSSFFHVFITCSVAYLCAKYTYKFSGIVYAAVIFSMVIPIIGAQSAMIAILQQFNLYNNWLGNFLRCSSFATMYFLVFFAAFKDMPNTYNEAAEIDGASQLRIMYTICIPLVMKMITTVFLIIFIAYWNDYTTPMLYLPTKPTLSYALIMLLQHEGKIGEVPQQIASLIMLCLPIVILFVIFKKKLMGNISMGGIKE